MKKYIFILLVIYFSSCTLLGKYTVFKKKEEDNWYINKGTWDMYISDLKNDTIFLAVNQCNLKAISIGTIFIPIIPVFFFKNDDANTVMLNLIIRGNNQYLINTDSIFLYTQKGDVLNLIKDSYYKQSSIKITDRGVSYYGYYKTQNINKIKELNVLIYDYKVNGKKIYLPPIKFYTFKKLIYRPLYTF